jgi:polyhydroxyalkanoate synthesis regulator phasin
MKRYHKPEVMRSGKETPVRLAKTRRWEMQVVKIEKMPKAVQEIIGNTQKRLTLWEGEARKTLVDTYNKIVSYPPMKKVEKFSVEMGNKAFSTIGVATKTDIQAITRKINKLRGEIRKITGLGKAAKSK